MRTLLFLLLSALSLCAQSAPNRFKNTVTGTNSWVAYNLPNGKLFDLTVYNVATNTLYLHVFDASAVPADGAYPTLAPLQLPANTTGSYQYVGGRSFTNGITICASTTPDRTTNATTASFKIDISYGGSQ